MPEDVKSAKLRKGESHFSQDDTLSIHEVEGQT